LVSLFALSIIFTTLIVREAWYIRDRALRRTRGRALFIVFSIKTSRFGRPEVLIVPFKAEAIIRGLTTVEWFDKLVHLGS